MAGISCLPLVARIVSAVSCVCGKYWISLEKPVVLCFVVSGLTALVVSAASGLVQEPAAPQEPAAAAAAWKSAPLAKRPIS